MDRVKIRPNNPILEDKTETLIAIGAATAANCIPCFEHLYEKATTSGITLAQIKRASDIAKLVKTGANNAIANSVNELLGEKEAREMLCKQTGNGPCRC